MRPAPLNIDDELRNYPQMPVGAPEPDNAFPSGRYLAQLLRTGARRVANACRRRRRLLLTPIVVMLPLTLVMALLLPRSYETSALLLLQEAARNNPLGGDPVAAEVIQQKLPGLEALLKSDKVLTRAAHEMQTTGSPLANGDAQAVVKNLRSALSVDLIGTDFLSVRLRGNKSEGLGKDLSVILGIYLEALLSESATSASQVVLAKQQQYIASLEERSNQVREQIASLPAGAPDRNSAPGGATGESEKLQAQLLSLGQQTAAAREVYDGLSRRYPATGVSAGSGILNAPGRIRIVDPPEDPLSATSSRLKVILGGIAAGILLGIVLAWAAEIFDTTIYDTETLVSAAGVPLLAVLSQSPGSDATSTKTLGKATPSAGSIAAS